MKFSVTPKKVGCWSQNSHLPFFYRNFKWSGGDKKNCGNLIFMFFLTRRNVSNFPASWHLYENSFLRFSQNYLCSGKCEY